MKAAKLPTLPEDDPDAIQARLLLRNPLLEPSVWILELNFGNFGGPFWLIPAHSGASGRQKSIPDDLTDLGTQNESSRACLRPDFGDFVTSVNDFLELPISKLRNQQFRVSISCPEVS